MTSPKRKPAQKALPLEKEPKALVAAPEPLFEGGDKAPTWGQHQDFHFVSWAFAVIRFKRMGDRHFKTYDGKHLKCCQKIMENARGDMAEVKRRMNNLWARGLVNPDYYKFTPQDLLGKWDDCHTPPADAVGGRAALKHQAQEAGWEQARQKVKERHRGSTP